MQDALMDPAGDDLFRAARGGELGAFEDLVRPLYRAAYLLAFGMLHTEQDAEDAVQEAAFKAWRKLHRLRPGTELGPWFLGIVANECRSAVRNRWWAVIRSPLVREDASVADLGASEAIDVRTAVGRLPRDQRLAIVLRFYLDLSYEEIAGVLRIPVGTARMRVHRALGRLRLGLQSREVLM